MVIKDNRIDFDLWRYDAHVVFVLCRESHQFLGIWYKWSNSELYGKNAQISNQHKIWQKKLQPKVNH